MTPIQLIADLFAVEVPEGAANFELDTPDWKIICTTKACTEEQAKGIVHSHGKHFRDYERDFNGIPMTVFTWEESLEGLFRSKSLNPETNYLIIKKIS